MKRSELIATYHSFIFETGLRSEEVRVDSGGALLLFGLRDQTVDLDLSLEKSKYDLLCDKYNLKKNPIDGAASELAVWNGTVDIHSNPKPLKGRWVSGVFCQSLQGILDLKLKLNRDKDQRDICVLSKLLGEKND